MFGQDFICELNHFYSAQLKSFTFETCDNCADKLPLNSSWFNDD